MCFWFDFSLAGLGMGLGYFVLRTPPLRVGAGLGNRDTHLWHRTRFQSCGLGPGGFGVFRVILGLVFSIRFSLFHRHFLALPPLRVA